MRYPRVYRIGVACALAALAVVGPRARPARAQSKAAAAEETAQVVAAAEALADHPSGVVKLFAKRLADVLTRNKVALPPKLAGPLQPNTVNVEDKDLAKVHDALVPLLRLAGSGKNLPAALRVELQEAVARHCPSSASSTEAAAAMQRLAADALSGQGEMLVKPEAAAAATREALYKCFDHVHCAWINADDVAALKLAAEKNLMGTLAYLLACTGEKPSAEALAKALVEVHRRVNEGAAPREAENAAGSEEVLKALIAQVDALRQETAAIAELAGARKDLAGLVQKFLAAVNQEDRKTASACSTPEMAKALEKLPSLRSAIGGAVDVEKIEFLRLASFGAVKDKRFADAGVIVSFKGDRAQERIARLHVQSTSDGWRIATP